MTFSQCKKLFFLYFSENASKRFPGDEPVITLMPWHSSLAPVPGPRGSPGFVNAPRTGWSSIPVCWCAGSHFCFLLAPRLTQGFSTELKNDLRVQTKSSTFLQQHASKQDSKEVFQEYCPKESSGLSSPYSPVSCVSSARHTEAFRWGMDLSR